MKRPWLRWAIPVLLLILATALVALLMPSPANRVPGDPANSARFGTRAVAQVLRQQGVDITEARWRDQVGTLGADSTLVVNGPRGLTESAARDLQPKLQTAGRVVLIAPDAKTLEQLGLPEIRPVSVQAPTRAADCPAFEGSATSFDRAYQTPRNQGCFGGPEGFGVVTVDRVTVIGNPRALQNDFITEQANASFALRLLGQQPRLVWYVPSPEDLLPGDVVEREPEWFGAASAVLAAAVLVLMLISGRRFGRLAREPMPVVVRAIETTLGRGRLYRRARDQAYAADRLRQGTRRRLATRARLGRHGETADLIRYAAEGTGRPSAQIADLLTGPAPSNDRELVALAEQLAELERVDFDSLRSLNQRGEDHSPNQRGEDHSPNQRGEDHSPNQRGDDHSPHHHERRKDHDD